MKNETTDLVSFERLHLENANISKSAFQVVGYELVGKLGNLVTGTDLVLTITKNLRDLGVVGKFVEFFGSGVANLSIADR